MALAGADGAKAEQLLTNSTKQGAAVLADITRRALKRWLSDPRTAAALPQARSLFNAEERKDLADALAATNATANLLGRARIRLRLKRYEDQPGVARFSDPTPFEVFDEGAPLEPLAPLKALAAFRKLVPQTGGTISTQLADGRNVKFNPHPAASGSEVMIRVDPQRIDAAFKKTGGFYLPPGQAGESEVAGRRAGVEEFLRKGVPLQASRAFLGPDGEVEFVDGRHRFAVLRDEGADYVGIMVPVEQVADFRQQFGAVSFGINPARFDQSMEREAFTLAVNTDAIVLGRVQSAISDVLATGKSVSAAPRQILSLLQAAGIEQTVGGKRVDGVYAENIFRTNMMEAYRDGAQEELAEVADSFPVWRYVGIADGRQRPAHQVHFDRYYPSTVPFAKVRDSVAGKFDGFQCRCDMIPVYISEWVELRKGGARMAPGYADPVD